MDQQSLRTPPERAIDPAHLVPAAEGRLVAYTADLHRSQGLAEMDTAIALRDLYNMLWRLSGSNGGERLDPEDSRAPLWMALRQMRDQVEGLITEWVNHAPGALRARPAAASAPPKGH
jgi:hypothetical protein